MTESRKQRKNNQLPINYRYITLHAEHIIDNENCKNYGAVAKQ